MPGAEVDVLVAGGGPAGLIATLAFAHAGRSVLCVDPARPVTTEGAEGADMRSTAFLTPSVDLLTRIGLWDRMAAHAMPLQIMRIVDAGGATSVPRLTRDFDAADLGERPFGWNLPNWLIRREAVAALPEGAFRPGTGVASVAPREDRAMVSLSDSTRITAKLVVAADGRDSPIRESLGIGARTIRYGQRALAFAVTHDRPHGNVSTEVHRSGGPFTLVPLPDREGKPSSAVVWMERGAEVRRLAALDEGAFNDAMTERSGGVLGRLRLVTRRADWPIISRIADRFAGPRVALIGEAAHVVPPIGAQGLNMSLADLSALVDRTRGDDPGAAAALAAWDRTRRPECLARVMGIDALNRASMVRARPLRDLRAAALGVLHGAAPIRQLAMRAGLGA